ncbi:NAC domain-containing protein 19-like isoform X2 [Mangifera indica]|uniref:NAC domain-containing protein 19-like isoform X2 n=1 Tax=Mangifera indica TaxID=29780 RepID=UPI001CF9E981|nr:NAC domain-containing protein 19-like isoform X2 [Mangifera indica]
MDRLVGLMFYFFHVKIISLLEEKRLHPDFSHPSINEVDIYQFDPYDLPGLSESDSDEQGWYFFSEPYYKYAKSKRANRRTHGGYWKITGPGCFVKNKSGRVIGSKKNLVFYRLGGTSKGAKTDWVMHEFYVKDESDPRYKKDFVICFIEKKSNNKSTVSTPDDGQPSESLSSNSVCKVTENPNTEVESQSSSSHHLIPDSGKNIAENSYSEVGHRLLQTTNMVTVPGSLIPESTTSVVEPQLLSSDGFVPEQMNHIPEITCLTQVIPQLQAEFDATNSSNWLNHSSIPALQMPINPDHYQGFNSCQYSTGFSEDCNVRGFEFPESTTSMVKPQLLSGHGFVPDPMYHIPEITCPMVDPQLQAEFDATNDSNWLNQSSIPALQLPIDPDHCQGFSGSQYSTGFSDDCNVQDFGLEGEFGDVNSLWNFENEFPWEVTGQIPPVRGDTETINYTSVACGL